ncbi:hypothetical protein PITCH_A1000004 [uncultured Desulfobacterium sp.]|uniref:Uncharacterized protein n=1 Tax=uncultured Desulfobacterium sp. TaxID=201089 RepID=A0A445MQP4_9BACT|nr:hypothetical protein PITCH_A1000004 [uncultured Desulfobacterium sp.]
MGLQKLCGRAFQKDRPQDDHEVPHGIDERQVLHQGRHVGDRGGKAREDDGRDNKEKGAQEALLLGERKQLAEKQKETTDALLEEGYKPSAKESLSIAQEFESVDLENWNEY